ncbi:hypothetical protein GCM10023213_13260 [Prosthecobacter algae]|jgi:hypothetical protein|uniref:Uncharacterized protein n=1 Tax=Prosthecobacter algae TaxID=1144682 RepID=A0ABP9NYD1_9BACT
MNDEPPSKLTPLSKAAIYLAGAALVVFLAGLITGGIGSHRPGEETGDFIALVLCRILSPLLVLSAWLAGFAAVLRRPSGPVWSAVLVMVCILIFIVLICLSAWRGTAAFHLNPFLS